MNALVRRFPSALVVGRFSVGPVPCNWARWGAKEQRSGQAHHAGLVLDPQDVFSHFSAAPTFEAIVPNFAPPLEFLLPGGTHRHDPASTLHPPTYQMQDRARKFA